MPKKLTKTRTRRLKKPVGSAIRIGQFRVTNFGAGKYWIATAAAKGWKHLKQNWPSA